MRSAIQIVASVLMACGAAAQQSSEAPAVTAQKSAEVAGEKATAAALARGIEVILKLQEGESRAEWPYEGVYKVGGKIPIGYRIGGTGICGRAVLLAPGFAGSAARQEALARAAEFIIAGCEHPLMTPEYDAGYDVRGWGYIYGLELLLAMKQAGVVEPAKAETHDAAIRWYINAIEQTEIPKVGGWSYSRPSGRERVCPPSPFMTAPTLQVLFESAWQGFEVDAEVVGRAVRYLESSRMPSGGVVYSGAGSERSEGLPGSVGRMLCVESTLYLAGRSTQANVRAAVDAFIVHWEWLNKRRAQNGTHAPPYGVAPYYFYFAHYHAAQAVELLPRSERAEYRRRVQDLLFSVQLEDGSWNDRVFPRSANYGTAMAVLALIMPEQRELARWEADAEKPAPTGEP